VQLAAADNAGHHGKALGQIGHYFSVRLS